MTVLFWTNRGDVAVGASLFACPYQAGQANRFALTGSVERVYISRKIVEKSPRSRISAICDLFLERTTCQRL